MCACVYVFVCVHICLCVCTPDTSRVQDDPAPQRPLLLPGLQDTGRQTDSGSLGYLAPHPAPRPQEKPSSHALGAAAQRPAHTSPRPQGLAPAQVDGPPVGPGPGGPRGEQQSPAQGPAWTHARDPGRVCGTALFESAARAWEQVAPRPAPGRLGEEGSVWPASSGPLVGAAFTGNQEQHGRPGLATEASAPRGPSPAHRGASGRQGPRAPRRLLPHRGGVLGEAAYREDLVCAGDWGGKGPR